MQRNEDIEAAETRISEAKTMIRLAKERKAGIHNGINLETGRLIVNAISLLQHAVGSLVEELARNRSSTVEQIAHNDSAGGSNPPGSTNEEGE